MGMAKRYATGCASARGLRVARDGHTLLLPAWQPPGERKAKKDRPEGPSGPVVGAGRADAGTRPEAADR